MREKIINTILILVVLAAVGIGFYFGNQKLSFLQSLFNRTSEKVVTLSSPGTTEQQQISTPESAASPVSGQASPEKLTNPISEPKIISPQVKGATTPMAEAEKPLTLAEIKVKVDAISAQVDILKIEVAKYNAEKQLEEIRLIQIQNQVNEIKTKIDTMTKEGSGLSKINSVNILMATLVSAVIKMTPILENSLII